MPMDEIGRLIDLRLKTIPDPFGVRASTAAVVKGTQLVTINLDHLENLAKTLKLAIKQKKLLASDQFGQIKVSPQKIFLLDSINFCFWSAKGKPQWQIKDPKGIVYSGWKALVASFDRALSLNLPLLDADWLKQLTLAQAREIFRGLNNTDIPLLKKRHQFLRQAGGILAKNFGGKIDNLIIKAKGDAPMLTKIIIKHFPYFKDKMFHKRAQIFTYDLSLLPGRPPLSGLDQLTIFADYRLPQWLRDQQVLVYQQGLAQKVDRKQLIASGSQEEVSIRASTVWAGELLAQKLNLAPALIDNTLWFLAKEKPAKNSHHRTLTTAY